MLQSHSIRLHCQSALAFFWIVVVHQTGCVSDGRRAFDTEVADLELGNEDSSGADSVLDTEPATGRDVPSAEEDGDTSMSDMPGTDTTTDTAIDDTGTSDTNDAIVDSLEGESQEETIAVDSVLPPDSANDTSVETELPDDIATDSTAPDSDAVEPVCAPACMNGGQCIGTNICECSDTGFAGNRCELASCSPTCLNGGTCFAPNQCDCGGTGYGGETCATPICITACLHGGVCVAPDSCDCAGTGYIGPKCETPTCDPPCMNGGICSAPDVCDCAGTGYGGSECAVPVCSPACVNGGECVAPGTCDCADTGFTGTHCEVEPAPAGFVRIDPGTFTMGSPSSEVGRASDEVQHSVTITRGFWLKSTEVTQGEWNAIMGNSPSRFDSCGSTCPVESVSWWDAISYTNALSSAENLAACYSLSGCTGTPGNGDFECASVAFQGLGCPGYRLPTEAEWEYAARAGTMTATYNGNLTITECEVDAVLTKIAWYCANSLATPHPVGIKTGSPWGLFDMLGNIWEWVYDWHVEYSGDATDPVGPANGFYRMARGGSWQNAAAGSRAATRVRMLPNANGRSFGFRVARTVP